MISANVLPLALTPTSSGFYCPKQNCKKPCRNENMLMVRLYVKKELTGK